MSTGEHTKWGYIYAGMLCASSALAAMISLHFDFQMSIICQQVGG
jgi:hypothetical protein